MAMKFHHKYDAWLRDQVQIGLESAKAGRLLPAEKVEAEFKARREAIIDFGNSGYIARFRHLPNGEITIARIKHQREDDFQ
jgi:plasmid stabilization system protein ParE